MNMKAEGSHPPESIAGEAFPQPVSLKSSDPRAKTLSAMTEVSGLLVNRRSDQDITDVWSRFHERVFEEIRQGADNETVTTNLKPWLEQAAEETFPDEPEKRSATLATLQVIIDEIINASSLDLLAKAEKTLHDSEQVKEDATFHIATPPFALRDKSPAVPQEVTWPSSFTAWVKQLRNPAGFKEETTSLLRMQGFTASREGTRYYDDTKRSLQEQLQRVESLTNPKDATATACAISLSFMRYILETGRFKADTEQWQQLPDLDASLANIVNETIQIALGDERWREGARRGKRLQTSVLKEQGNEKYHFFLVEDTVLPRPGDKMPKPGGKYDYFAPTQSSSKFWLVRIPIPE